MPTKPATERQTAYLTKLAETLGDTHAKAVFAATFPSAPPGVTHADLDSARTSRLIDAYKEALGTKPPTEATATKQPARTRVQESDLNPGGYLHDGVPIRVYPARESGRLLASAYIDGEWKYQGLATRTVTPDMRMTLEDAKRFGVDFGICVCCGRVLTEPESKRLGIGPVCLKKNF